ncbi:hypothetical protein [Paractinoplanes rishiriensis]|uniref:Uncharacterized protein n=1 Tax=Paractinoplanes rishiriensis TaxID=1050105 RepID=A0A919JYL4_9ACTN|nr:hypothetical protein [Actinoplanes rishiriensis]GIE97621.1 hypothetical protein Ari01nite_50860 [Actinoplanes rishiriensis]
MKLLLTSAGVTNPSIDAALTRLLRKLVADSNALAVAGGAAEVVAEGDWKLFPGR